MINLNTGVRHHLCHAQRSGFPRRSESRVVPSGQRREYVKSISDGINQDFGGRDFSGLNTQSPLPEISNFHHEQGNLSLSSHNLDSQNMGLSSHHFDFNIPAVAEYNYSDTKYPYTTIDNFGRISLHTTTDHYGHCVGYLSGRQVYNSGHHNLGYAGTDGKIYDNHNKAVGWVDNNGNVYNNGGVKVHHTNLGVVGAAAYLLCSYYGGAN